MAAAPLARLVPPRLIVGEHEVPTLPVATVAGGLVEAGVRPGDVVAFDAPTAPFSLLAYLACWRVGAVAAPLHHRLTASERSALLGRLDPRIVLTEEVRGDPVDPVSVDPDSLAVLLATSGSSGTPKLVRHLAGRLAMKGPQMAAVHGLTAADTILLPAPMAHVSGLLNGLLLPAAAGMRVVLVDRWSPAEALHLIPRHQVTFMIGPPTYFVQLRQSPGFSCEAMASLRLVSCGGAGVTQQFAKETAQAFDCVVKRTYGSTEAPTVTTAWAGDPAECGWSTDGRAVSADVELEVRGDQLWVRAPELFDGYEGLAWPLVDGWFATGDRAQLEDGWLTILGRLGDGIIRGGENVDPVEVEAVCGRMPGVQQAVVVGVPDEVMGQRVGLVVVGASPTLDQVRAHCAQAGLARFKTPELVARCDDLPVLTVGKPDRAALSRLLAESARP